MGCVFLPAATKLYRVSIISKTSVCYLVERSFIPKSCVEDSERGEGMRISMVPEKTTSGGKVAN